MAKEPAPLKYPPDEKLAALYDRVLEIALELPGVVATRSYGTPAIKVGKKLLARLRSEAEGGLAIMCDFVDRQMLLQAAPETFYVTDHYQNYPMVLINLETVRWDAMPGLVEQAWRMGATKTMLKAYGK